MQYYFLWNGVNCRTKGIRLQSMPEIVRPEERVNHITIPGRSGELTQVEGNDIFNSYIQTIPLAVDSAADVAAAEKWLKGDGYVTFCCQPLLKQRARVINAVTFKKHSPNSSWYEADVQFYCDPLKQLATAEDDIEVTESGTVINNPGSVNSKPKIVITGSGDITIRAGGKAIVLTDVVSGWTVDSDTQYVLSGQNVPMMGVYTGDFPELEPGEHLIQFTGSVTKLTITPRWRYL